MKNYCTRIAAEKLVGKRVRLGTSRHQLQRNKIEVVTSVGTARNHTDALKLVGDWLLEFKGKHLKNMSEDDAAEYLCLRALSVGQSGVDLSRQAINFHLLYEDPIPFIPSVIHHKLTDRAYTPGQIDLLLQEAKPRLRRSIVLAVNAGLRAHELITIALPCDLPESPRQGWVADRFSGRQEDAEFVVHGKGGLHRAARLSPEEACELMDQLRPHAVTVVDRKVRHTSHFDLLGGSNFSSQFSRLSMALFGFSHGAHGLRHSFAQARLHELMCTGLTYAVALNVLSNELGHFANSNTFAYLRD